MTDWERTRWRKLYLREPKDQEIWAWQTRGLRDLLIRIAEDDGRVGRDVDALRRLLRAGDELDVHVQELLADGFLEQRGDGVFVRNLPEAQTPATPPRSVAGGRWAGTTAEERIAAARRASEARWGRRADASHASTDASPHPSPHASPHASMRRDASTHSDASVDASVTHAPPRAVSEYLDPSESLPDPEDKIRKDPERAREPTHRKSSDATHASSHALTHASHDASRGAPRKDPLAVSLAGGTDDDHWVFERWAEAFGKTGADFDPGRCACIAERRLRGMTRQDAVDALAGAKLDPYVTGAKDGKRHDRLSFIFGDAERYEEFRDAGRARARGRDSDDDLPPEVKAKRERYFEAERRRVAEHQRKIIAEHEAEYGPIVVPPASPSGVRDVRALVASIGNGGTGTRKPNGSGNG